MIVLRSSDPRLTNIFPIVIITKRFRIFCPDAEYMANILAQTTLTSETAWPADWFWYPATSNESPGPLDDSQITTMHHFIQRWAVVEGVKQKYGFYTDLLAWLVALLLPILGGCSLTCSEREAVQCMFDSVPDTECLLYQIRCSTNYTFECFIEQYESSCSGVPNATCAELMAVDCMANSNSGGICFLAQLNCSTDYTLECFSEFYDPVCSNQMFATNIDSNYSL